MDYRATPVGVASIITGKILAVDNLMALIRALGLYILTIIGGVAVYQVKLSFCSGPMQGVLQARK